MCSLQVRDLLDPLKDGGRGVTSDLQARLISSYQGEFAIQVIQFKISEEYLPIVLSGGFNINVGGGKHSEFVQFME